MSRIHIVGPSGSGTSTLGAALARELACPHVDADTLFWMPTDPPFVEQRPREARQVLLVQALPANGRWIFSGSATGWAGPVEPLFDLIVFLTLDPSTRMERLRRREIERYGERINRTGDMVEASAAFLKWALAYETAGLEQRSRATHEQWLASQAAPVLRLDSSAPLQDLVDAVLSRCRAIGVALRMAGGVRGCRGQ
jgi:adenylate kinase family enzyme